MGRCFDEMVARLNVVLIASFGGGVASSGELMGVVAGQMSYSLATCPPDGFFGWRGNLGRYDEVVAQVRKGCL